MSKPDNFVEDGALLPYGSNVSAPSIELPDTDLFKSERGVAAKAYFDQRIEDLHQQFNQIKALANDTELVYSAKYNFIPRVGQEYFLYINDEIFFLSMISPDRWDKYKFFGSFRFTANSTWERT